MSFDPSDADVVHLEALLGGDDQSSIIIERYETTNQSARDTIIVQGGVEVPRQCAHSISQSQSSKLGAHQSIRNTLSRDIHVVDLDGCFKSYVVNSIVSPTISS